MAVQAITKEGRESLSVLTAELKKGLPALEAELMARLIQKTEETGDRFAAAIEEEKESIRRMTPPAAKTLSALKGENTKLRKQIAALEDRVDGLVASVQGAGNVGEDAPLSVASVNERVSKLRDVVAPWMQQTETLVLEHAGLIKKLKAKYPRHLA